MKGFLLREIRWLDEFATSGKMVDCDQGKSNRTEVSHFLMDITAFMAWHQHTLGVSPEEAWERWRNADRAVYYFINKRKRAVGVVMCRVQCRVKYQRDVLLTVMARAPPE